MKKNDFMWTVLVHLGNNMWNEEGNTRGRENNPCATASSTLRFDRKLWDTYMEYLCQKGANTLIIDVAEAMQYETHPELAVKGSWTKDEMRNEVERLRQMGFEVVPKLNFSAAHDVWLGEYSHMLSTSIYRQVCADLIREVCEVFKPKYFHIGMDEENWALQQNYNYAVIRQNELWWKDFFHLVNCVEKENARAWIWSDRMWEHTEEFLSQMPKSVLQSNWHYGCNGFYNEPSSEKAAWRIKCFELLNEHGFDQVPTGSNWNYDENMGILTRWCKEKINPENLLGMMQTPWLPFIDNEKCRHALFGAADELEKAIKAVK